MKEFNIKLTDEGKVYINDKLCECAYPMDKESKEDDLNKRAILALANEMGYEAIFLFEEMADRLDEMLDELPVCIEGESDYSTDEYCSNSDATMETRIVSINLDKVIPEMIQLCIDIHGQGISHIDAVRITELLEDSAI